MFERFSESARRAVHRAQQEARQLQHNYIGTEHLLLGLIGESGGGAARVLRDLGVDLGALDGDIKARVGRGASAPSGHIPFTSHAKKAIDLAMRESARLGGDLIGTEHLLLGVIRGGEGVAAQVLIKRGVTLERIRREVTGLLGETGGEGRGDRPGARGSGISLDEIAVQLRAVNQRLAAIEAKLGIHQSEAAQRLRDLDAEVAKVRRRKEAAIDEQDFERAASARDQEKRLLAARHEAEEALLHEQGAADDEPPAGGTASG